MKNLREMGTEFIFLHLICGTFEVADVDILNIVLMDDGKRGLPIGSTIKCFDIILPCAEVGASSSPLRFVIGPVEHGWQTSIFGDAPISGIASADSFRDHTIRRGLHPFNRYGFIGIVALNASEVIERPAQRRIEVVGFIGNGKRGIGKRHE